MSAISSPFRHIAQTNRHHGIAATARWLGSRIAEKLLCLEVSELLYLDVGTLPSSIQIDPEFSFRFLTPSEVARFVQDPKHDLTEDFVSRAASGHDLCLAALHGERLASYSWYARNFIEGQHHVGVPMTYPADVAYMYNAFTNPEYRGRRLFSMGIALALKELAEHGVAKLITTINSSNFASLQSCRRLGFSSVGRVLTIGRGTRRFARTPPAARQLGIDFGDRSNSKSRQSDN
jgi:hypothetical protein